MDETPLVSVIVAAYNAEAYLAAAIESVLHQSYRNWELIVADDCSTDRTAAIVKDFQQKNDNIQYLKLDVNSGQAVARNLAIEKARGKYLAILDADDIALPSRLEEEVAFLERNRSIAAVGSDVDLINEDGKVIGRKTKPDQDAEIRFRLLLQTQFITSSVCIRTEVFRGLGGFDREYTYAEDYDLWSRMAQRRYALANIHQVLTQYRIHGGSVSISSETQPAQAERALRVNERNVAIYLPLPREKVLLLVRLVNGFRISAIETCKALYWYRRLLNAYCADPGTSGAERAFAQTAYRDRRRHAIRVAIKRLLHIRPATSLRDL